MKNAIQSMISSVIAWLKPTYYEDRMARLNCEWEAKYGQVHGEMLLHPDYELILSARSEPIGWC